MASLSQMWSWQDARCSAEAMPGIRIAEASQFSNSTEADGPPNSPLLSGVLHNHLKFIYIYICSTP